MIWERTAAEQHGCVTRKQLRAAGESDEWIKWAVAQRQLLRLGPGLYRVGDTPAGVVGDIWAAVLRAGPFAFAYRRSAALMWCLDGTDRSDQPEVALARNRHPRQGSGVHRLGTLRNGDVTSVDGLRVTTPLRTLLDLAGLCDPDLLERAAESALRARLLREDDLLLGGLGGRWPGGPTWREVVTRRPPGAPATESDAETRFVQLCRRAGLPAPVRQHPVVMGRRFRLDFAWVGLGVAVEIDGRSVHGPEALGADLRRQNRIVLGGWVILRFTFEDVVDFPDDTAAQVRRALDLGAFRSLAGSSRPR